MSESEYIARISYGKDSLKMLEVIRSRGLPLDRITTTDVWATDTISANLPPMEKFKARMDQKIWDMYRIEVEHLCARNPDGTKRTYEQMFYHVPKRKSGGGTDKGRFLDIPTSGARGVKLHSSGMPSHRVQGTITGFPPNTRYNWCQKLKICGGGTRDSHWQRELLGVRNSKPERNQGFPAQISPWCRKLKIDKVKTPFPLARHDGQIEISWSILVLLLTNLPVFDSWTKRSGHRWWNLESMRIYAVYTASITKCWHQPMKHHAGTAAGSAITRVSTSFGCCEKIIRICGHC